MGDATELDISQSDHTEGRRVEALILQQSLRYVNDAL